MTPTRISTLARAALGKLKEETTNNVETLISAAKTLMDKSFQDAVTLTLTLSAM